MCKGFFSKQLTKKWWRKKVMFVSENANQIKVHKYTENLTSNYLDWFWCVFNMDVE